MIRIRARRVHPVTAPPIEDGAVLVGDDGRIVAVGPHLRIPAPAHAETLEFPQADLIPGLVNVHTHLELTHLAGRNTATTFPQWVRGIRELKDACSVEAFAAAAEQGIRDAWTRGVTCVADTGSSGAVAPALARLGGRGIVYHEVFGPHPAQRNTAVAQLEAALAGLLPLSSARLRIGLSPHAPYSVSADLYRALAEFARLERLPLALHLAESRDETEFVHDGAGQFAVAHHRRGIPVVARGVSPVRYLRELGVLALQTQWLAIHCVQVDAGDIRILAEAGGAVAVCPRSNRAHGHGTAPFQALRAAGLRVGLGTDSVVSVPDLDLWAEAAAVGLAETDAVRMLTLEGARALEWDAEIGSLQAGKAGDLAVFSLSAPDRPRPSVNALLTVIAGRIVHRA